MKIVIDLAALGYSNEEIEILAEDFGLSSQLNDWLDFEAPEAWRQPDGFCSVVAWSWPDEKNAEIDAEVDGMLESEDCSIREGATTADKLRVLLIAELVNVREWMNDHP